MNCIKIMEYIGDASTRETIISMYEFTYMILLKICIK